MHLTKKKDIGIGHVAKATHALYCVRPWNIGN